jgi:hypothetical protein
VVVLPPPRVHQIRYHGLFAPRAKGRDKVVPERKSEGDGQEASDGSKAPRRYRLAWAILLSRTFRADLETCPRCQGRMRVMAALTDPSSIRRYLEGTGQSADIPEIAPARAPPQEEFDFLY